MRHLTQVVIRGQKTDDLVTRVARANVVAHARADEGYMSYTRFVALMATAPYPCKGLQRRRTRPLPSGALCTRGHLPITGLRNPIMHISDPVVTDSKAHSHP
jgi:hypothetical protein